MFLNHQIRYFGSRFSARSIVLATMLFIGGLDSSNALTIDVQDSNVPFVLSSQAVIESVKSAGSATKLAKLPDFNVRTGEGYILRLLVASKPATNSGGGNIFSITALLLKGTPGQKQAMLMDVAIGFGHEFQSELVSDNVKALVRQLAASQ